MAEDQSPQAYATAMQAVQSLLPEDALERLRALRLWHWNEVVRSRDMAEKFDALSEAKQTKPSRGMYVDLHRFYTAEANMHLRAVQWLNDYFPPDDHVGNES